MNTPSKYGYVHTITDEEERKVIFENLAREASFTLTICEQLRFIYDVVVQLPYGKERAWITAMLIDAMGMAKKMDSKLSQYRNKYSSDPGSRGKNLIRLVATRRRKRIRGERIL